MDEKPSRSRTAWPGPMSVAGVEPGHEHQLPAPLVQRVRLLARAVVIFGVCLVAIGTLLVLVILERGEQRDRENARLERLINEGHCDWLDTLPPHPLLDGSRKQFDCGPGTPIDQLPPDVREQLGQARPQVQQATPAPTGTPPPLGGPAVVDDYDPQPESPTPRPGMAPVAEPRPPLVDLEPITDPLCDALGLCL